MTSDANVDIREANTTDVTAIASIYNHYISAGGSTFDHEPWSDEHARSFFTSDPFAIWCVAVCDQAVIGWSSAKRFSLRFGYRFSLESAVYLNPKWTGRSVGEQLMRSLERACRERDIHHLMARIVSTNQASIRFHDRIGFEIVGVQKEIGQMNGHWLDVTLMQKLL